MLQRAHLTIEVLFWTIMWPRHARTELFVTESSFSRNVSNAAWVNAASLGLSAACYANDVAQQVCVCARALICQLWQLLCVWTQEPGEAADCDRNPVGAAVDSLSTVIRAGRMLE